jgi:hypothetical protein
MLAVVATNNVVLTLDNPAKVVVVFPRPTVVDPMVTGVLKLASRFDNGIEVVAVPNVYGTGIFRTSLSIHVQVQMY